MLSVFNNPFSTNSQTGEPQVKDAAPDAAQLLSSSRRLDVIEVMAEEGEQMYMSHLADEVTKREAGEVTSTARKRVYITLYQSHLDQLDRADVVTYHKSDGIVEPGPQLDAYNALIQDLEAGCRGDRHD